MNMKKLLALLLAAVMLLGLVACKPEQPTEPTTKPTQGTQPSQGTEIVPAVFKQAEYNSTTSVMPSNWNAFTYTDGNDTQILSFLGSSFFTYDYKFENDQKFNPDGSINKEGIVPGAYTVDYNAATKLEDVTATVDAKWGYTDEQKAKGGYAWKITLRDDLKWHDGTPITAADFEYSMKEILDPAFMNYRANTYYDTLMIKNSKHYFFQNEEGTYNSVASMGYATNLAAIEAGEQLYIKPTNLFSGLDGFVDAEGNPMPEWIKVDGTIYAPAESFAAGSAEADGLSGEWAFYTYNAAYLEVGKSYASSVAIYVENEFRNVAWEDVGCYAIPEENAIVVCLDKNYNFLTEDGDLSVWSAYYMSSLPLVKKDLYESCKIAPSAGSTLWTSNYNSSLETTASWGWMMLTEFEAGSHYRLEKNPNWFGWGLEEYKNQYNITAFNVRKVEEFSTKWMGFLGGIYDDASLQTENVADYLDSKYVYFTSALTGTYGMQLFSDLEVLKESENNNGILAIQEFRHAFNMSLNRSDVIEKIWPGTAVPCFGLLNVAYYYDIENAPYLDDGGQYRNNVMAKEGILRAYGYTQAADGTWSSGELTGLNTDEAYETLTGYNPVLAKEKMKAAIEILLADPEYYGYDATKDITLIYGSSQDTDKQRFRASYVQDVLNELSAGTALEGKIKVVFDASAGSQWSSAFRSGATQIGFGYGFQGNMFNPFDIVGAFVNPDDDLNYHMYWDTSAIDMTLTMPEGDYTGAGETITMSVQNWYYCLNGLAETENQPKTYDWGAGLAPNEARLMILSALEELTIKESRSVMLIGEGGGSFLGAKFRYFSEDDHTFMSFGGYRYMEVMYTDEEWAAFVAANNNDLSAEYKKSE